MEALDAHPARSYTASAPRGRTRRDRLDVNAMSTGARNQPQPEGPKSGCFQRDLRLDATRRNRLRRNGKEGVQGSSP